MNCTVMGEHILPVRSDDTVPATRYGFFFSFIMLDTPNAIDEAEPPTMVSNFSFSIHWRAMLMPTLGLFWSSATVTSMGLPSTLPPKSSTAMRTASDEPGPPLPE